MAIKSTLVERMIEAYNKGTTYTCWNCFTTWQGRYTGRERDQRGIATYCVKCKPII